MNQASQIAGFAGTLIVAVAYLPQVIHLIREHCSAGVSLNAWLLWLLGSILILSHAFNVMDIVFVVLQVINIVAILLIILLCKRYSNMVCAAHRVAMREAVQSAHRE